LAPSHTSSCLNRHRRIEPDAQHRTLRQLDLLALGRRNRAAAADQNASQRALEATENATEDRTDACAGSDASSLALDPLALDRLGDGAPHGIRTTVHRHLIETDGHLRSAVRA